MFRLNFLSHSIFNQYWKYVNRSIIVKFNDKCCILAIYTVADKDWSRGNQIDKALVFRGIKLWRVWTILVLLHKERPFTWKSPAEVFGLYGFFWSDSPHFGTKGLQWINLRNQFRAYSMQKIFELFPHSFFIQTCLNIIPKTFSNIGMFQIRKRTFLHNFLFIY